MARQSSFALDVNAFVARAQAAQDRVFREIVMEIARAVIMSSPVDTGRFRGNWQLGVDRVPAGTIDFTDPTGAMTTAVIAEGTIALRAGDVAYIVNNLPYAIELEYGHSQQAPQGMVRITLERFQSIVRQAIANNRL